MLARIAGAAHGVATRTELLEAGLTLAEIRQRLAIGALLREYPGVYRVGHRAPSMEARYLAAARACGGGALLSGPAAGHLLGVLGGSAPAPEVEPRTERRVDGIVTHRSRRLDMRDGTVWRGVPVTTAARTLVDIAAFLDVDRLARACHEAGVLHRTTPAQVEAVLARRPNSRGAAKLRRVLRGDERVTLSKLDRGFLLRLNGDVFEDPALMVAELRDLLIRRPGLVS